MLTFDATTHAYHLDGHRLPSVTGILREMGLSPSFAAVPPDSLEFARARGSAVHRACELDDAGELDEASVDPQISGYLVAFREWRRNVGARPIGREVRLASRLWGFAGTADWIGFVSGSRAVVDLKTSASMDDSTALQLAAYADAWNESNPGARIERHLGLRLAESGRPQMIDYTATEPSAPQVWRSAVIVYNWRNAHVR